MNEGGGAQVRAIQVIVNISVPDDWRAEAIWWPEGGTDQRWLALLRGLTEGDMLAHEWKKQLGRSGYEILDVTVDGNHIER